MLMPPPYASVFRAIIFADILMTRHTARCFDCFIDADARRMPRADAMLMMMIAC